MDGLLVSIPAYSRRRDASSGGKPEAVRTHSIYHGIRYCIKRSSMHGTSCFCACVWLVQQYQDIFGFWNFLVGMYGCFFSCFIVPYSLRFSWYDVFRVFCGVSHTALDRKFVRIVRSSGLWPNSCYKSIENGIVCTRYDFCGLVWRFLVESRRDQFSIVPMPCNVTPVDGGRSFVCVPLPIRCGRLDGVNRRDA